MEQRFYPNSRWLIKEIEELESELNYSFTFSESVLYEICLRYEQDIPRYKNPNLIKQVSYLVFWIKKLKPIFVKNGNLLHINGLFALFCALAVLSDRYESRVPLSKELLDEIIYSLRYRFTSLQTLFLIFNVLFQPKNT